MKTMKKNPSSTAVTSLRPPVVEHYYNRTDDYQLEPPLVREDPTDEYDLTLVLTAARLGAHAGSALHMGDAISAAGLFRDAARLTDLLRQRQGARFDLEDAQERRKSVRS